MSEHNNLLMIHGLMGSIDYFSPAQHLPGIAVHTPDLLGYGGRRELGAGQAIDLRGQAAHVAAYLRERIGEPAWLLGHSVGGAIAMMVADEVPHLVRGLISVEGNFTLNDAFWCSRIAAATDSGWAEEYRALSANPLAWLERAGIAPDERRVEWARSILANQPPATLQSMARSVVRETGASGYLALVRAVIERGTPLYLLAGERSEAGWDVPGWVRAAARGCLVQPRTGHMMMLEDPAGFARLIAAVIQGGAAGQGAANDKLSQTTGAT